MLTLERAKEKLLIGSNFLSAFWSFVLSMYSKIPRSLSNNIFGVFGNFRLWAHELICSLHFFVRLLWTGLRHQPGREDSSFFLQIPKHFQTVTTSQLVIYRTPSCIYLNSKPERLWFWILRDTDTYTDTHSPAPTTHPFTPSPRVRQEAKFQFLNFCEPM